MVDEINARLGLAADVEVIQNALTSLSNNSVADDLRLALSAVPLHLHWIKELPLTDPPPEITRLWVTLGDQAGVVGLEDRLDQIVDRPASTRFQVPLSPPICSSVPAYADPLPSVFPNL
jgi:hypothetical protein